MTFEYKPIDQLCDSEEKFETFTAEEIAALESIKTAADITSFEFIDDFEDDHETCVNVVINGIKLAFFWISSELFAEIIMAAKGRCELDCVAEHIAYYADEANAY